MNRKTKAVFSSQEINKEFLDNLRQFIEKLQEIFSEKDDVYLTHTAECKLMKKGTYVLIYEEVHHCINSTIERSYCAINIKTGGIHNASSRNSYTKSSVANVKNANSYSHMDDGGWLYQWNGGVKVVMA